MIGYISGNIIWADSNKVILSVNGLGYEINFANNIVTSEFSSLLSLFIVNKLSEYGEALFGFKTIEEKIIFENLDSIKGVGSKVLFAIMSNMEIKTFSDLQTLTLDQLVKLPGVGKSTAQKFLLGLSNKLKKEFDLQSPENKIKTSEIETKYKSEVSLLVEWGMKKSEIIDFLSTNVDLISTKSSEQIIKLILQSFRK